MNKIILVALLVVICSSLVSSQSAAVKTGKEVGKIVVKLVKTLTGRAPEDQIKLLNIVIELAKLLIELLPPVPAAQAAPTGLPPPILP